LVEGERRERCEEMEQSKERLGIGNDERKGRNAGATTRLKLPENAPVKSEIGSGVSSAAVPS
jgi:hypothetical protein